MTPAAVLLSIAIGLAVSVGVIRLAVRPLLLEVRALRVDVASGLALGRARRPEVEVDGP